LVPPQASALPALPIRLRTGLRVPASPQRNDGRRAGIACATTLGPSLSRLVPFLKPLLGTISLNHVAKPSLYERKNRIAAYFQYSTVCGGSDAFASRGEDGGVDADAERRRLLSPTLAINRPHWWRLAAGSLVANYVASSWRKGPWPRSQTMSRQLAWK